ncbi:MAG TPA: Asp-tRNA(Asn)/Glu-tRNA(Gln) amidotransferase subunit GatB [Candidatus Saccharimonadales bacterium]|nr:Asp-tRNA(Asn)/Glu-tRNA(Gln) amidotransferase subunit GatB [Candidatus Saccharimonadales bacterium]
MNNQNQSAYKITIGIECHVQLKTVSKLFSGAGNDAREAPPNSLVNHIDFGLPGALPVLNQEAVHLACRAAFALNTRPQSFSKFDRKHYFYPDLPMGYQITQFDEPIILGGNVDINIDGERKTIGITRAHIEADAGKSTHPEGKDYSLVDLNRAGTPLLEIVSEPDMHTALEAKAYATELYLRMRYADVSDANLYYGNMRFDVNVSVSKTDSLGTRTETKNLNSFRSIEKAIEYEARRQISVLEEGGRIIQETRGWDDTNQKTFTQRTKENADDYRYMPDPDIPPVILSQEYISSIEKEMPTMPDQWRQRLQGLGLDQSQTDTLLLAEVEDNLTSYLRLIEQNLNDPDFAKFLGNWFVNLEIPLKHGASDSQWIKDAQRADLYKVVYSLYHANKLSSTNVKALLSDLLRQDVMPEDVEEYAEVSGYIQMSNEAEMEAIVAQVIKDNDKAAMDVKSGEMKAIGFLVGQVMKLSNGKANPGLAKTLIEKQLGL